MQNVLVMLTRGVFRWVCAVFNNLVLSLHIQYCLHYFFFFLKLLFRPTEKDRNQEKINKKKILLHVHYTSPKVDVHIVLF